MKNYKRRYGTGSSRTYKAGNNVSDVNRFQEDQPT